MTTKLTLTLFIICIGLGNISIAQNVNIPDSNFKYYLLSEPAINTNGDGDIQVSEASTYAGSINAGMKGIADLTGIETFTALTHLDCRNNQLTSLNISFNTALTFFDCFNNSLTHLNVSANTALNTLVCSSNQLTTLDVSANTALTFLGCNNNQLTSLNVSANTALDYLNCCVNQLTSLNVSGATALTYLVCSFNPLIGLNVSGATALYTLICENDQLANLNVSDATTLNTLQCSNNQLTALNILANTALRNLECRYNLLTSLNLAANTSLSSVVCNNNQLTSLDVSANTALAAFYCDTNQLISLNLKNGSNTNFIDSQTGQVHFFAKSNSNLTCIQVDNATYSSLNWSASKDSIASYSENCFTTDIANRSNDYEITIYPNPYSSFSTLNSDKILKNAYLTVYNSQGQQMKQIKNISGQTITFNRNNLVSGLYILFLTQENKTIAWDKLLITDR